ncbi:MAG: DUF2939 domain-containing protein [Erythrobacter sp.]|uniref:DUF2939 domain-containing protein n=1 Tax=Erythrobacter sp. TaxID=1042 RepID=UPI0025CBC298|nr:DUF2939 domain-containing protein [Erythrobacter sp.]MCL9998145.1 DUF2939 domain-containing protein [Erythrobacter sp.]
MKNRVFFGSLIALLIAGAGGWYFFSPGYAMTQLADAAREGDEGQLRQRVDFPRVREALKADLRAKLASTFASEETEGFGKLGAALGMAMIDPMVEGFVTPESIGSMVRNGKLTRPGEKPDAQAKASPEEADWAIEREGISRFKAMPVAKNVENPPALVFERDGIGWRLVEIDLPDDK